MNKHNYHNGAVNGALVAIISLGVGMLAVAGLAVWAYMQYNEQKTNVDSKIDLAVAASNRDLEKKLEEQFHERENAHTLEFVSPDDLGRITFAYPRPWSVYIADDNDKSRGSYEAYFSPERVPPVRKGQRFSLRLIVDPKPYSDVLGRYERLIDKGELKSSAIKFNGNTGTRLDGQFDKDIRGSAVIFKVRDKTVTLQTDAQTYGTEFNKLLKTVEFND